MSERSEHIPHMDAKYPLSVQIAILVVLVGGLFLMIRALPPLPDRSPMATSTQPASAANAQTEATSTPAEAEAEKPATTTSTVTKAEEPKPQAAASPTENPNQVRRIKNPYATNPLPFESVNVIARSALVNIFCSSTNGLLRPISGSGVLIDPKGIILTNAHVAQYVMLAESGRVNLACQIRAGSPATPKWEPHVLYLPPVWIDEHAQDLTKQKPLGTGKHDYALLYAGASIDGTQRPILFPSLTPDTREAIGFVDDTVLAASYPAEFLGAIATSFNLYPVTSITTIDELLTLGSSTVDVVSIGSIIGAQSGSSGGAIANAWARLIGIITTTTDGETTGARKLRGITTSYINRDIQAQSGYSLSMLLSADPALQAADFRANTAPALVEKLLSQLQR